MNDREAAAPPPDWTGPTKVARVLVLALLTLLAGCGGSDRAKRSKASDDAPPPISGHMLRSYAELGNLESIRKAVERKTDLNQPDEEGRTALMIAAFHNHHEIVKVLIDNGANCDLQDQLGRTALMFAATGPAVETVQHLIDAGAAIDTRDRDEGYTALMFAAAEGQADVVRLLLEHGADATLVDVDGESSMDFARSRGHQSVVELLDRRK